MIAAVLYQSGRFTADDAIWVWQVLAGSTIGLLAATWGRLYSSTFYALRDTRTPLRFAVARVIINLALGGFFALYLPGAIGLDRRLGVAGLTAASGIAAWIEFFLLRRALTARIGKTSMASNHTLRLWGAGIIAAILAWALKLLFAGAAHPVFIGLGILAVYGMTYLGVTTAMGVREATEMTARLRRRSP